MGFEGSLKSVSKDLLEWNRLQIKAILSLSVLSSVPCFKRNGRTESRPSY